MRHLVRTAPLAHHGPGVWRRALLLLLAAVGAAAMLAPVSASAHQDYSLAPGGASPFHYSLSFTRTTGYGVGCHVDHGYCPNWGHWNDHHAIDLVPAGSVCGRSLYPIWNNLRVDYVDRTAGRLDMSGWVGGRKHRLRYLHMDSIYVNPGQTVGTNNVVGTVGSRGYSSGCHLHLSVHVLGGDNVYYSRRPVICGREISQNGIWYPGC